MDKAENSSNRQTIRVSGHSQKVSFGVRTIAAGFTLPHSSVPSVGLRHVFVSRFIHIVRPIGCKIFIDNDSFYISNLIFYRI